MSAGRAAGGAWTASLAARRDGAPTGQHCASRGVFWPPSAGALGIAGSLSCSAESLAGTITVDLVQAALPFSK